MKRLLILSGTALALLAAADGLTAAADAPASSGLAAAGRSAFVGEKPLVARLPGHMLDLPAEAVRCVNCHASTAGQKAFAPRLTSKYLNELRSRRGGPGSRYDLDSFCRLLREGLDPAGVMINTSMPRYTLSPQGCGELWTYLGTQ